MPLLSDLSLRMRMSQADIVISPQVEDGRIQPASIELTLANHFWIYREIKFDGRTFPARATINGVSGIDPEVDNSSLMDRVEISDQGRFALESGGFALSATREWIEVPPDMAARVEGKSSLGRLGMGVHTTAGFIDPGFRGQVTLELWSAAPLPILLRPGMPIAQICYFELTTRAQRPYGSPGLGSHYQDQEGPQPSRAHDRGAG
jgi:dCTP deaminase